VLTGRWARSGARLAQRVEIRAVHPVADGVGEEELGSGFLEEDAVTAEVAARVAPAPPAVSVVDRVPPAPAERMPVVPTLAQAGVDDPMVELRLADEAASSAAEFTVHADRTEPAGEIGRASCRERV